MRETAYLLYHCNLHPLSKMIPKSGCVSESLEKWMKIQIPGLHSQILWLGRPGVCWESGFVILPMYCTDCVLPGLGAAAQGGAFQILLCPGTKALCDIFVVPHFGISIFFLLGINGESRWYLKNEKSFLDKLISWPNFVGTSSFPAEIWSVLDSKSLRILTLRGFSTTGTFILKARMPHKILLT